MLFIPKVNRIVSRTVCLGNFIFDRLDLSEWRRENHCKNRIDYALEISQNPEKRANLKDISKYVVNDYHKYKNEGDKENGYFLQILEKQQDNLFKYRNVKMFVMDSFSELTDKLYVSKSDGKKFLAHHVNVTHSDEFKDKYEYKDLLPLEDIEKYYAAFFEKVIKTYGEIPILFFYFPTALEKRDEYIERGNKIYETVEKLKEKYKTLTTIALDVVEPHPTDKIPYHFSDKSYDLVVQKIEKTGLFKRGDGKELPRGKSLFLKIAALFFPVKKLRKKVRNFEF